MSKFSLNDFVFATCHEDSSGERFVAGIMKIHDTEPQLYLHFTGVNSRLDGWYRSDEVQQLKSAELHQYSDQITKFKDGLSEYNVPEVYFLHIAGYSIRTWYWAPFPQELQNDDLYCCEKCLNFMSSEQSYRRHLQMCRQCSPPGNEVYRDSKICVFQVDGAIEKNYCRNISYLARLFLLHKTLFIDVDIFYFYVMYARVEENDSDYRLIGYFSKEKSITNILSCILTLPCYQGKGYGTLLIETAYMLCSRENIIGGPEKPLSDLGFLSFQPVWQQKIVDYLIQCQDNSTTVSDIVKYTLFTARDIVDTLRTNHVLLVRNQSGELVIYLRPDVIKESIEKAKKQEERQFKHLDAQFMHYWPFTSFYQDWSGNLDDVTVTLLPPEDLKK